MSSKKFRFVSPGVFLNEIDNSALPVEAAAQGPVIIGRTARGPGLRPVVVQSYSEFVEVFGNPVAGNEGGDIWRKGNTIGPTYAAYAAQAWLRAGVGPATIVRLMGVENPDKDASGRAGWDTTQSITAVQGTNGGAYGLFVFNSASQGIGVGAQEHLSGASGRAAGQCEHVTGTLAAVWYLTTGSIELVGRIRNKDDAGGTFTSGAAGLIESIGTSQEFRVIIRDGESDVVKDTTFNFDRDSSKFIRDRFNTNPQMTNSTITQNQNIERYWLGETYTKFLGTKVTGSGASKAYGVIMGLESASVGHSDMRMDFRDAETGWFFSQDLTTNSGSYQPQSMQKLFKFVGLNHGEWIQNNLKVSIEDIKTSNNRSTDYGSFSVVVRDHQDTDAAPKIVERYSSCNLNPNSVNYVARKIGTEYSVWNDSEDRFIYHGKYTNASRYLRIVMDDDVDAGVTDARYLPYGVYGPVRYKGWTYFSGSTGPHIFGAADSTDDTAEYDGSNNPKIFALGLDDVPRSLGDAAGDYKDTKGGLSISTADVWINTGNRDGVSGSAQFTGSVIYPAVALRATASSKDDYFGYMSLQSETGTKFEESNYDILRARAASLTQTPNASGAGLSAGTEVSWYFTLDDIRVSGSGLGFYTSGSRQDAVDATAHTADQHSITAISGNYESVLDAGYDRFTAPFYGGYDGLDITEAEPFRNSQFDAGESRTTQYTFHTLERAIKAVADPEVVEANLMVMPGITNETLTTKLIETCTDRADALAIIDLKGDYKPFTESTDSESSRIGSLSTTVTNLKNRNLNSSYGCCYYPWVQIRDSENSKMLYVPPSIVALGTFASSQNASEVWFAPAGFNRGGLTQGSAGLTVTGIRERLTSKNRDTLYEANINPIATFPSEGIVVFGQKTLQVTQSALDRINVRRLMIFIKKEISRMANEILFDQNVQATWDRFTSKAVPFLESVKARLGLTDFKVVLDTTTPTPDLIDRNIMYAKIFLKPARAIEFIAIDFMITNTGAAFDD